MSIPADPASPLVALGADGELLAALTDHTPGGRPVRVVRVDRDRVAVSDGHRTWRTDPERSLVDDPDTGTANLPVVGDWVLVSDDHPPAVVRLGPRHGRLVRRDPGDRPRPQVLASGVDVVIITVPLDRPPNIARLERELVTALDANAEAIVALTKRDLCRDLARFVHRLEPALDGVPRVATQCTPAGDGDGVAADGDGGVQTLRDFLAPNRTGILIGASGAGKSTLTNAIVGARVRAVGTVRAGDARGRHTTATRALVRVPGGGTLIDTPGLRALGLWDAQVGLDRAFPEIAAAAQACRFDDCAHEHEPGCAVRERVEAGTIRADRLERYLALFHELVATEEERAVAERQRRRRADRGIG